MINKKLTALGLAASLSLCSSAAYAKSKATLPLEEIRNFVDVYNVVRNQYVEEEDGKTLIDYAIKGMLNGLDPHSIYLKKESLEDFKDNTSGSYLGYGLQLEMIDGQLIILTPIPNSPAEEAGIKPNDQIIKIDDIVVDGMSMPEVSRLLLKEKDSVTLTILRKGSDTQKIKLKKSTVNLPSVNQRIIDKKYGYIRITQFQLDTAEQFETALLKLMKEDIAGLVLDLRNNPGGLLASATATANMFLDAGLIVSTKNQNTGTEDKIHADKETLAKDLPLVVLINEGSASASELLAGALQSHKRAVIVGQRSFGKGSVQNIIPLDNGDAIKLTIARYYTPSGESIQAKGITPDIVLSQLEVEDKDESLLSYGEANIPKHLDNDKANHKTSDEATENCLEARSDCLDEPEGDKDDTNKPEQQTSDTQHGDDEGDDDKNKDKEDTDTTNSNKDDKDNDDKEKGKSTASNPDDLAKSDLQLFEAINVLKVLIFKNQ